MRRDTRKSVGSSSSVCVGCGRPGQRAITSSSTSTCSHGSAPIRRSSTTTSSAWTARQPRRSAASCRSRRSRLITSRPQAILEYAKRERKVSNALLHAFRVIGDGIAWRALGYDRAALTILGEGVRVGRLAAEIGRDEELAQLEALWKNGVFGIHNDITNRLRHGDLTIIQPGNGHVRVNLMEVKRAGGPREHSAQLKRMDRAVQLLNTGEHVGAEGDPLEIIRVPVPYRTYLANLRDAVAGSRDRGIVWTRPAPCLAVLTVDYGSRRVDPERLVEQVMRGRDRLGWFDDVQRVLIWSESQKRQTAAWRGAVRDPRPRSLPRLRRGDGCQSAC